MALLNTVFPVSTSLEDVEATRSMSRLYYSMDVAKIDFQTRSRVVWYFLRWAAAWCLISRWEARTTCTAEIRVRYSSRRILWSVQRTKDCRKITYTDVDDDGVLWVLEGNNQNFIVGQVSWYEPSMLLSSAHETPTPILSEYERRNDLSE